MDPDSDNEGVINLSTSQRSSGEDTPNGSLNLEDSDQLGFYKESKKTSEKAMHSIYVPDDKRDNASPLHSLPASDLHQLQQILQQQILNPQQFGLQSLIHHQNLLFQQQQHQQGLAMAELSPKQLEQVMQHLQEQLQINLLQQTQLLQTADKKKTGAALQHLGMQQQQLMQQMQLAQRQYLLHQGLGLQHMLFQQTGMNGYEVKEKNVPSLSESKGMSPSPNSRPFASRQGGLPNHWSSSRPDSVNGNSEADSESQKGGSEKTYSLYGHGVCRWPGCDTVCDDLDSFRRHMNSEHSLSDCSMAQTRVQMEVVSQLEQHLERERCRLQAMMQHLHISKLQDLSKFPDQTQMSNPNIKYSSNVLCNMPMPNLCSSPSTHTQVPPLSIQNLIGVQNSRIASLLQQHSNPSPATPVRRRVSDKALLCPGPYDEPTARRRVAERCSIDISEEIHRNRESYKNLDVRPPFTYASLIRQAIIESADKQLTLNEIYNWFTSTFCYFRRNAATWKNAVRHNLSLHKCFMRVENVKGAVWTVDEMEFYKRRPQRIGSGNAGSKSPNLNPSPTLYGEVLNASLQAALGDGSNASSFLNNSLPASMDKLDGSPKSPSDPMQSLPLNMTSSVDSSQEEDASFKEESSCREHQATGFGFDQRQQQQQQLGSHSFQNHMSFKEVQRFAAAHIKEDPEDMMAEAEDLSLNLGSQKSVSVSSD